MRSRTQITTFIWLALAATIVTAGFAQRATKPASVGSTAAQQRDKYLQAARIAIDAARVQLELDLTPGAVIADSVIADIDRDDDGLLSAGEQRDYAARVLDAVELGVDRQSIALQLVASTFPDPDLIRRGEGMIRVQASVVVPAQSVGAHQLLFRNAHRRDVSVYLANAVVTSTNRVMITAQHRDGDQRELAIDYVVGANGTPAAVIWLLVTIAGAFMMARLLAQQSPAAERTRNAVRRVRL